MESVYEKLEHKMLERYKMLVASNFSPVPAKVSKPYFHEVANTQDCGVKSQV